MELWGRVTGEWGQQHGDIEAPRYNSTQYSVLVGGDYSITKDVIVGAAIGWTQDNLSLPYGSINTNGVEGGVYASYEQPTWYVRGVVGDANYSGNANRQFGVTPSTSGFVYAPVGDWLASGVGGVAHDGKIGGNVVSVYGEVGRPFVWDNIVATPFLGLGYTNASLNHSSESGVPGADLSISGSVDNEYTELGARFTGSWGMLHPQATIAWEHNFGADRTSYDASFSEAPTGSNFQVESNKYRT